MTARVGRLRPSERRAVVGLTLWAALLAGCAGAYGLLVGPALKALFGGEAFAWPGPVTGWAPPAPSIDTLRSALPWVIVGVAALKTLARYGYSRQAARLGVALTTRLQRAVYLRAMALPPDVMGALGSGAATALVLHDAPAAQQLWVDGYLRWARDGLQLVVLVGVCLILDWRMALVGLAVYPLAFWPMDRLRRGLREAARAGLEDAAQLSVALAETFGQLSVVQRTGRPQQAEAAVDAVVRRWGAARMRASVLGALASPMTELLGAAALAAVLVWSTQRVVAGEVAPEHALGFFVALLLVYEPAKGLARARTVIEPGRAALGRIVEFLERPERLRTGEVGEPPPVGPVPLRLENVRVRRGGRVVLSIDDLHLPGHGLVAVTGPNGAGKTTLAWLLAGLLSDWEGSVWVGAQRLEALAPDPWRRRIGWVAAERTLQRGSLRALVTGGRGASDEALADVARLAGLEPLLARLPHGWATVLDEAGRGLSSGETQRVQVARALWGDPAILVLDEPEAHLDQAGRDGLVSLLQTLTATSCCVLLISHDPRMIELATARVRLVDGRPS